MMPKTALLAFLIFISCNSVDNQKPKTEIQIISQKIAHNPTDINLLYERVEYNRSRNNLESCLYDLKEIVRLDSLNAIHHTNIAQVYFDLSKGKSRNAKYPSLVKYHLSRSIDPGLVRQNGCSVGFLGLPRFLT